MHVRVPLNESTGVNLARWLSSPKKIVSRGLITKPHTTTRKLQTRVCRAREKIKRLFADVRFLQALHIAYWHLKTLMDAALALTKDVPDARASVSNPCQPLNETPRQTLLCEHICPSPKKVKSGEGRGRGEYTHIYSWATIVSRKIGHGCHPYFSSTAAAWPH